MGNLIRGRVYSIGMYAGPSPLHLEPASQASNPVLTRDSPTGILSTYVADPFMIRHGDRWIMFFEVVTWRRGSRKGEIAYASSPDGLRWHYEGLALVEPFRLSYPYVFAAAGEHWMIPETGEAGAVRLYRADPFPGRWTLETELLTGGHYLDSSVFRHDDRWWMFSLTHHTLGTLRLFHAPDLTGPWREHPANPIVRADHRISRPAGRVVSWEGRPIRFAQDCRVAYGTAVQPFVISRLTVTEYAEEEFGDAPLLSGTGSGWNRLGMHHVDAHQLADGSWLACVDGWTKKVRRPREIVRWAGDRVLERRPRAPRA